MYRECTVFWLNKDNLFTFDNLWHHWRKVWNSYLDVKCICSIQLHNLKNSFLVRNNNNWNFLASLQKLPHILCTSNFLSVPQARPTSLKSFSKTKLKHSVLWFRHYWIVKNFIYATDYNFCLERLLGNGSEKFICNKQIITWKWDVFLKCLEITCFGSYQIIV